MASRSLTLYTGVTGNLCQRILQHKRGEIEGFTKKYHTNRLAKRLALIKIMNPTWQDLAEGWGEPIKLQIPHFVRDDNSGERQEANSTIEFKNRS